MAYYGAYGSGVNDGANGWRYLGIWYNVVDNGTTVTVTAEIWFKDTTANMGDSSNTLYFDINASSATTSKGSITANIKQVETKIATYTVGTYTKGTSAKSYNCSAKWANLGATNSTVSVTTAFTVPALESYTISYNANGGTGAPSSQTKYYATKLKLSSTVPTRSGFTFTGWATSSNGAVMYQPSGTYTANASVTLYAVWKEKITDIYIYKSNLSCEACEFIEGNNLGFNKTGQVYATEFIESSNGIQISSKMQFGEFIER